jgi:hypothetical protein
MRDPPDLARCPVDGVPLLLVVYGGVVILGCELCDCLAFYAPREPLEPSSGRNDQPPAPFLTAPAAPTCYAEAVRAYAVRAHE